MTRESITADINSRVAENSLCWWDGRNRRTALEMALPEVSGVDFWESCIDGQILHVRLQCSGMQQIT
jgi:hypothetical protein